ncbi:transcriptional regulator [Lactobacillus delbrueckii]|uniref:transcriptional regulator n=1 Tax=Lactobacillus delbrueckii TaxID=1584 RepID=UPI003A598EC9
MRTIKIDILRYLDDKHLTIYRVAKESGYGYTTLHKSFNKQQSTCAIARAKHLAMWQVLRELENDYLSDDDDD